MIVQKLISLGLLMLSFSALAQIDGVDYDWQEQRNNGGIIIYTSSVEGSGSVAKFSKDESRYSLDGFMLLGQ